MERNDQYPRPSSPRSPPESTNRDGSDHSCHDEGRSLKITNEAHLWNGPRPITRQSRPGERVWLLWKDARRIDCDLRESECGAEVQLLVDGEFYSGRRHASRECALRASTIIRERLKGSGWTQRVGIAGLPGSMRYAALQDDFGSWRRQASESARRLRSGRCEETIAIFTFWVADRLKVRYGSRWLALSSDATTSTVRNRLSQHRHDLRHHLHRALIVGRQLNRPERGIGRFQGHLDMSPRTVRRGRLFAGVLLHGVALT